MVVNNQRFQALQCGACRLHLPDDIDAVAVLCNHFPHRSDLTFNSGQSGVGFLLC